MQLPRERGPISRHVIGSLGSSQDEALPVVVEANEVLGDDDAQLALWILYELHYRGFDDVDDRSRVGPRPAAACARRSSGASRRELRQTVGSALGGTWRR